MPGEGRDGRFETQLRKSLFAGSDLLCVQQADRRRGVRRRVQYTDVFHMAKTTARRHRDVDHYIQVQG